MPTTVTVRNQAPWWQTGVIYQIYPRSFQDSNGDGIGDLKGIARRLDYLTNTLGVDAIWISPFYPSPMLDFGYDVSDYQDVAPMFGTLADFDELLAKAHGRNLRVIIDYVPNHTSDQHPWFLESRTSRENPRHDWYIWADAKPDGAPPNNWLSVFGGSAWEWDEPRGQYYLHRYLKEQPDLNWRNPEVKRAMLDVLRFWLDRSVDGFRIDVAHGIMKDPALRDNPPNTSPERPYKDLGDWDSQLHVYDEGHPDIHEVYREVRRLLDSYNHGHPRVAGGEIHVFDYPVWASYFGMNHDELHLPFNFGLIGVKWTAMDVRRVVDAVEGVMRPDTWPTYVLGNHDEHRIASRIGPELARVAQMLLLTLRGTPTMYYGDELGMTDVPIAPQLIQDPWEHNEPGLGLGRDPERTPMQWDGEPAAGFTQPGVTPWLPVSNSLDRVNVERELRDTYSMLTLTRELLRLRRGHSSLQTGAYRPTEGGPEDVFIYRREDEHQTIVIALNFGPHEREIILVDLNAGRRLLSTHLDREPDAHVSSLILRPYEGCMVELVDPLSE
jgi:alpha-glucosidase